MKKIILVVMTSWLAVHLTAQEIKEGVWLTGEENTQIETYEKDGMWYGKIISSDNPKAKIGKDILQGFQRLDDEWKGKLYAAKKGKLLDAVIQPTEDVLSIRVSAGLFKKKLTWHRSTNN